MKLLLFFTPLMLLGAFYSQDGQDEYVEANFFHGKKNGVFVDIGAHDGISFSNTYHFETDNGWTGLCIEPIPEVFAALQKNRKAICVQGCIAPQNGTAKFLRLTGYTEMLSGLADKYDPKHKSRIENELRIHGGTAEEIEVQCFRLNDLLRQHGLFHVDYLSIDTEGNELDILRSIDFDMFRIDIIDVENNYHDPSFHAFMLSKGYILMHKHHFSSDEIYKLNR